MEKNLQRKVDEHFLGAKHMIREWWQTRRNYNASLQRGDGGDDVSDFLKFVFDDIPNLLISKDDFQKRKRVKHAWGLHELCIAKRADGEQCTRKMKEDKFCGTHSKAQPHGIMQDPAATSTSSSSSVIVKTNLAVHHHLAAEPERVEVWVQEIKGINYYIDKNNNVYKPGDIIANKQSPSIIAKWGMTAEGRFCIPKFNL
jgi:hypothetical protein